MSEERPPEPLVPAEEPGAPGVPPDGESAPVALDPEHSDAVLPLAPPTAVAAGGQALSDTALQALLRAVFAADLRALHWLGREHAASAVARGVPSTLSDCLEGRAWGAGAEMRWKRIDLASWSVLYLGESAACPSEFTVLADDLREVEAPPLRLWGKRDEDGLFRAERLAVPLAYPGLASESGDAAVPCRHLVDRQGVVRFVRLAL